MSRDGESGCGEERHLKRDIAELKALLGNGQKLLDESEKLRKQQEKDRATFKRLCMEHTEEHGTSGQLLASKILKILDP